MLIAEIFAKKSRKSSTFLLMTLKSNIFNCIILPEMAFSMIPKNPENLSTKVRLPCPTPLDRIQRHWTHSEIFGMKNPVKSSLPAILSIVSKFEICPTQLNCERSRIRLKLYDLYAENFTPRAFTLGDLEPEYWSREEKTLLVIVTKSEFFTHMLTA